MQWPMTWGPELVVLSPQERTTPCERGIRRLYTKAFCQLLQKDKAWFTDVHVVDSKSATT